MQNRIESTPVTAVTRISKQSGSKQSGSKQPKRLTHWWGLLLIPVIALGLWSGGARLPLSGAGTVSKLETALVSRGRFRLTVTGPGTLEAGQTVDLKPEVNGTVTALPTEGQRVTRGQLLVRLDRGSFNRNVQDAQLAVSKAQAQLEGQTAQQSNARGNQSQQIASTQAGFDNARLEVDSARKSLSDLKSVFNVGGASANEVSTAASNLSKAESNLISARSTLSTAKQAVGINATSASQDSRTSRLAVEQALIVLKNAQSDANKTKIFAPINGVISSVAAQVGGTVSNATPLLSIIDDAAVELPVQVDETEIGQVRLKQSAEVTLDALPNQIFQGKVSEISPKATVVSNIAVFYVRVRLENPNRALRPGMSAEADITTRQVDNALMVVKRAVTTVQSKSNVQSKSFVQVLGADGKTQKRQQVQIGADDGTNIVIIRGLTVGQTVVLPNANSNSNLKTPPGGN
jgi:HlyD family secretion protein